MKLITALLTTILASSCSLTYSRTTYTDQGSRFEFGLLGSTCNCPKAPGGLLPLYVSSEVDRTTHEEEHDEDCEDHIEVVDYTVAPGDTVETIAQAMGTTVESIQAFNPDLKELKPGMILRVPVDGDDDDDDDDDEDCDECKKK